MENCRKFAEKFSDYIDDSLPNNDKQEADQHLVRCPECNIIVKDTFSIIDCLKSAPKIAIADSFEQQVYTRVLRGNESNTLYGRYHTYFNIAASLILVITAVWTIYLWKDTNANGDVQLKDNIVSVINNPNNTDLVNYSATGNTGDNANIKRIGWIGAQLGVTEDKKIYITEIVQNDPAYKAGLLKNDTIIAINDTPINQLNQFDKFVKNTDKDVKILKFKIKRNEAVNDIEVHIEKRLVRD